MTIQPNCAESEIAHYTCYRTPTRIRVDGDLTKPAWQQAPKSGRFVDMVTGYPGWFDTRCAALWDETHLYIAFWVEEPFLEAQLSERDSTIFQENDIEVFFDGGDCYYEFEINALGTIWELNLPKPYGEGGVPVLGCNLPGLKCAVQVRGTLNDPSDVDEGWSVEAAFPWKELGTYNAGRSTPPNPGDVWRMNFSRVQWEHEVVNGGYVRVPPHGTPLAQSLNPEEQEHPENNWVWSPQGQVNMHLPLRWGVVEFGG
jgi:hypothetical protein